MDWSLVGSLAGAGLIGGFMAGFLGIGGGVIMIPLLLYVVAVPMKLATGLSVAQAFAATVSGLLIHRRSGTVDARLGLILGATGLVGALVGSIGSADLDDQTLLGLYLLVVVLSLALLVLGSHRESAPHGSAKLNLAIPIGFGVGALAGILGVGGGFILIPLMISVLRVRIKVAVGTSLLAILAVTLAGGIGKVATGQFDLPMAIYLILGSILGAQLGGRANARVSSTVIRVSLIALLLAIVGRTAFALLAG